MHARITTVLLILAFVLTATPSASAQTADVSAMLTRMQSIMTEMQALQKEFQTLVQQVGSNTPTTGSPAVLGASTSQSPVFTQPLVFGETNDDIERIQRLLATDPEIYDHPYVTGYFGAKTEEAIKKLQTRFGLSAVGVIGPATTELLEGYMRAYPNGNYPDGVLSTKPTVLGASTSGSSDQLAALQQQLASLQGGTSGGSTSGGTTSGINPLKVVYAEIGKNVTWVDVIYTSGKKDGFEINADEEDEIIEEIADEIRESEAHIEEVLDIEGRRRSSSRSDADEGDAEDAIDDADDAIDNAEDEIDDADADGDDVDWAEDTLSEAKDLLRDAEDAFDDEDYDEAIELAEEAEDLADEAIDRIDEEKGSSKGDSDEIDEIRVDVYEGESEILVEYDDGDDFEFTIDEDSEEDIIEEVADELDIDEDDVEDVIEFHYGDVDRITVRIDEDEGTSLARVFYESGVERRVRMNETDEDDIIEEIADAIDEDEDDVEDWVEFD